MSQEKVGHSLLANVRNIAAELTNVKRREELASLMLTLGDKNFTCFSCEGFCCTSAHNSMLVTPLEVLDVYEYLLAENRINDETISLLESSISEYRLDKEMLIGKGREFRRNYTCPFFNNGPRGCSISPKSKPYGCLGFNALEENVSERGHCTSYVEVLEKRDHRCRETEDLLNEKIKKELGLWWDKKNLPVALLSFIRIFK